MKFTFYDSKGKTQKVVEHVLDIDLTSSGWVILATEGGPVAVVHKDGQWQETDDDDETTIRARYYSGYGQP